MNKYDEYPVPAIADLLEQLCPEGVPEVMLGDISEIKSGSSVSKKYIAANPGDFPVINSGKEPLGFVDSFNSKNPIGVTTRGANVGYVSWTYTPHFKGNLNYDISVNATLVNVRFLFFQLKNRSEGIHALCTYGGIPALNQSALKTLTVDLPPLEVQEQIVGVLEVFTDLGASLNRELTLREEQLRHYRRSLIAHSVQTNSASFEPVGRIATVGRGKRVVKKDLSATPEPDMFPVFQNSIAPMGYSSDWNVDGGVAFTIIAGSSSGSIGFSDEPFWAADDCLYFEGHDGVDNRYLYHVLLAYNHQLFHHVTKASMPRLHRRYVESLEIPLPPLDVQEQIVDTLDMFTDYTDNLGREIDLRRQQLEYYRGQLLTFPVAE